MRCNGHHYSPVSVKGHYNVCATDQARLQCVSKRLLGSVLDVQNDDGDTRFL